MKEILSDKELMQKYSISEIDMEKISTVPPYHQKIVEVLATIINAKDNNQTDVQIYKLIKNIHKL